MDPVRIAARALFAYVVLFTLLRLAGKRFVVQATGFDFVLALVVGDLVDDLLWAEVGAAQFVAASATLVLAHVSTGWAYVRSGLVADFAAGRARLVMRAGAALRPPLRAERVNDEELASFLRGRGLGKGDWPRVRSGWIEGSGRFGVLQHDWARAAQRADRGARAP